MIHFVLDGSRFSDRAGFYQEVQRVLTQDLDWEIGQNLDAFADVLAGGFGRFELGQNIQLTWLHAEQSRQDLGQAYFSALLEIIEEQAHIEFCMR